ncbi:CsgG/HfaB family protein [Roseovarius sp. SYSU LYC5161]|uniref:CsgG/HfaB family protein n=1 Tax=Roseovarius halophilus (ex Wu et al. 2025) TaxID=3376060 RepID=UPI003999E322
MTSRISRILLALAAVAVIGGCVRSEQLYEGTHVASVGNLTAQNRSLREIAPPAQRQIVAVYDFPDLTGQYKERDRVQSLSRAVTQAGAPLLIKALQDASNGRWFSVLDRSSLEAVVQERQIIERMRQQYRGEQNVNPAVLGPLMHAGIIITGGVVGYDTNMNTGGVGARYLGIGANREWKYDVVSVNIRAVSTETGEVLANVVARKPIASIKDQGDVFRYIELDKLLEAEAGYSTNEPRQIAVQQSVEKAVMGLIAEGAMRNIWSFDSEEAERKFISGYRQELFNGEVPPSARAAAARPATRKAAAIPQTRPVKRAEDIRTRRNRPKAEPDPPPPPRQDEVLG